MKLNKFIILLLSINGLFAQQNTTAKIRSVNENGLHKIFLPAEIRSYSKEDLGDFRIYDAKNNEVPYFVIPATSQAKSNSFSEFKLISKNVLPGKKTTIVIETPKTSINEIVLSIANSVVTKYYDISGSNDQKEWFGMINNAELFNLQSVKGLSVFKTLELPLSSYRYLKIEFDDKKTLPINVLKVGVFANKIINNNVQEIHPKSSTITQYPSQKKTRIRVLFDNKQIVNQIVFNISSPRLYKRNARVYLNKIREIKHRTETYQKTISTFELNSDLKKPVNINQLFEKEFTIEIENQDNQPLSFSEIKFFQNQVSIIADLKAGEKYGIKTGNPKAAAPKYDLENFKSKMADNLPKTTIYKIKRQNSNTISVEKKSIWQQTWFMWLCIGLGGIAILFYTVKLVKDMKNNSSI
ncbi:MAG TPA: hypothetical protein VLR29_02525 [Flavobacterium sp.]|nr:hypothetical protein [Flavobacterium sp.]